ncbi:MAG TPA: NmrA family NAD(P)-binding protein [Candidatus Acidoferrum sp.]|nr:NmrA family NAD(P)-binding protein [Candidatus Acidoferrum sp.]
MYTVLGASGHTGAVVANRLLDNGKRVRVVGREAKRLEALVSRGAEPVIAEVTDAEALTRAFAGNDGVYAMTPPDVTSDNYRAYQDKVTEAVATAIEQSGVKYVVTLSSVGADKSDKTGPVAGLHAMEERFADIAEINVLHLRAGYFMENVLPQAEIIRNFGMMAGPLRADLMLPLIATKDIGAAAAEHLLHFDFNAQTARELLGQRDVSYTEIARIVGTAIGRPALAYIQLAAEQVIMAMTQMGMSRNFAGLLCEMAEALNIGYMKALEPRTEQNTTPTTFEAFVEEVFLPAFKGQAAGA